MCNCLYNLLCPNQGAWNTECNRCGHHEFHHCHHRRNRIGSTYMVTVTETPFNLANDYGPSTVNFETPIDSIPYVYQYQGNQGANQRNLNCPCANQRRCNLYIVNEIY